VVLTLKVALNCKLAMNIDSAIDLTAGYQVKNNAVIG
jgi:hypothetical protein